MTCHICGGPTREFGPDRFCENWKCWPVNCAAPELIAQGASPLTAELTVFGNELIALLNKHAAFVSYATELENPNKTKTEPIVKFCTVMIDIMWNMVRKVHAYNLDMPRMLVAFPEMLKDIGLITVQRDAAYSAADVPLDKSKLN